MRFHLRFCSMLLMGPLVFFLCLASRSAMATPVDYVIFDNDALLDIGTFTVDSMLANPIGQSNVNMSAFSISESFLTFGTQTVTLADQVGGTTPHVQYFNGVIDALSANSQFMIPGIFLSVDITPPMPSMPLDFVGILQLVALTPDLSSFENGPVRGIGIRETTTTVVPEPTTMFLFGTGLLCFLGARIRRKIFNG